MSNGYNASVVDITTDEKIIEVCKDEYESFIEALKKADLDIDDYSKTIAYGEELDYESEDGEKYKQLNDVYEILCDKFLEEIGMGIELNNHDSDNQGDCYDEVDGYFWEIFGVYVLSKSAKKHKDIYESASFVSFG